jgi:hypothetical protein
MRKQGKFISYKNNKQVPVIARLYGKEIVLISNDEKATFITNFSLYQLRLMKKNTALVKDLIKKGLLKDDWSNSFDTKPTDDCCLGFPGGN